MNEPLELVFVYGTLRSGGSNHFRMAGSTRIAAGWVIGKMYRIDWYPALVLKEGEKIFGEVYSVNPSNLRALDQFEGLSAGEIEGSEYRRTKTVFSDETGQELDVWVWEWIGPIDESRRIEGGDWLKSQPKAP
jgi:gamma-glutamylcyclotransferase (GGCT)/AIG2-like uncharacterized protein YtfP